MSDYKGVIIEESLESKQILQKVKILSTKIEKVNEDHKTPWLTQWTLHTIEVPEAVAQGVAEEISSDLEIAHPWYADFKNETHHFIIFRNKVFKVNRIKKEEYQTAAGYGLSLGIPDYQLNFPPDIK